MTTITAFTLWFLTFFGLGTPSGQAPEGPPPPDATATDTEDTRQQRERCHRRDNRQSRDGIFNGF